MCCSKGSMLQALFNAACSVGNVLTDLWSCKFAKSSLSLLQAVVNLGHVSSDVWARKFAKSSLSLLQAVSWLLVQAMCHSLMIRWIFTCCSESHGMWLEHMGSRTMPFKEVRREIVHTSSMQLCKLCCTGCCFASKETDAGCVHQWFACSIRLPMRTLSTVRP